MRKKPEPERRVSNALVWVMSVVVQLIDNMESVGSHKCCGFGAQAVVAHRRRCEACVDGGLHLFGREVAFRSEERRVG